MTHHQHRFYMVDPSLLPAAGVKTATPFEPSKCLASAQETLSKWHVERQSKTLAKIGMNAIVGAPTTPRGGIQSICGNLKQPASARSAAARSRMQMLGSEAPQGKSEAQRHAMHAADLLEARRMDPRLRGTAPARGPIPPGLDLLIDGLRNRLQRLGVGYHKQLEQMFIDMDIDRSGHLCSSEFQQGLQSLGLCSTAGECDLIFNYFDEDRSGHIDFREFLTCVKGKLSDVRRKVVREAFGSLDVNGDGALSVEDLHIKFHSHQTPDVRSGVSSEEQVYRDFLNTFDTMCQDGNVTIAEFEQYYEYLSSLIANDDLFCATVRNAWNLPGAMGGSCLKVSIIRGESTGKGLLAETKQELVEIRPDIGMTKQDPRFFQVVRQRLEEMGYHDIDDVQVLNRY